ncbi:MAG: Phosphatidate cytidylyltransferase [Desulfotomaculum sp. 46_296]|nr:MAG: Phosphatidate cytidylyltransferase [Desulfotomaculum sp. 46_296]
MTRVISSLIAIPLVILLVWQGGLFLIALCALVMFLAMLESKRMLRRLDLKIPYFLMALGVVLLLGSVYLYGDTGLAGALVSVIFIFLCWFMLSYPGCSLQEVSIGLLSTLYIGLLVYVYLLRTLPNGWIWIVLMLFGTWVNDTMAFLIGKNFGKHPLFPALSPGKTIEGSIGGILGSVIVVFVFKYIYPFLPLLQLVLLGLFLGIAAQVGDLVESGIKRQVGIKDAGTFFPGHGGILDRVDSILFTAPLVYYYVQKLIAG